MSKKTIYLLAMHGMPPSDFPRPELAEWGRLHSSLNQMSGDEKITAKKRYEELDRKIRQWPRNDQNDPYHNASYDLALKLKDRTKTEVVVGFNEFCRPSMAEAFEGVSKAGAEKVVVITPMMTRGGSHSERDIPSAIDTARKSHPGLEISYVWPFDSSEIARFLAEQANSHLNR